MMKMGIGNHPIAVQHDLHDGSPLVSYADHDGSPLVSYAEATFMKPAELCPSLNLQHKPTRRRLKKFSEEKQ